MKNKSAEVKLPDEIVRARDRSAEALRSQLNLFHSARDIRDMRDSGDMSELWLVAQALVICGLPYEEIKDTLWVRKARLADGSELKVTFAATEHGVPLPYGQDRGPLYFLVDRALARRRELEAQIDSTPSLALTDDLTPEERSFRIQERNRIIDDARFVRWNSASEYLDIMGKSDGGKQYTTIKERMNRISSCAISIVRTKLDGEKEKLVMPIVKTSRAPGWATGKKKQKKTDSESLTSLANTETDDNKPLGFEIGPDFFMDFSQHHVPVPLVIVKKLLRKPKLFDLVVWLCWRVYAAKTDTFIPASDLRAQLGTSDSNDARILSDLRQAIKFLKETGWKELRAEVVTSGPGRMKYGKIYKNGLNIGPPAEDVHFNPSSQKIQRRIQPVLSDKSFDSQRQ